MTLLRGNSKGDVFGAFYPARHRLFVIISLLCALQWPTGTAFGQCADVCGDMNRDGVLSNADLWDLFGLIYSTQPTAEELACADVDGHELVTLGDFVRLAKSIHNNWGEPTCTPGGGPLVPQASEPLVISYPSLLPAGEASMTITFSMQTALEIQAICLPLRIRVDGEIPTLTMGSAPNRLQWNTSTSRVLGADATALLGFANTRLPAQPGTHALIALHLTIEPVAHDRPVQVEFVDMPPIMNEQFINYPMAIDTDLNAWQPVLQACAVTTAGDLDRDGLWNSADIVRLINYVFKGGSEPEPCVAAGDVNCNGSVGSNDIIAMVSFVFRSGEPPCDICPQLATGVWTCP